MKIPQPQPHPLGADSKRTDRWAQPRFQDYWDRETTGRSRSLSSTQLLRNLREPTSI